MLCTRHFVHGHPRAQGVRDARGRPRVGPATRFVSHAWSYPFADLLAALFAHGRAAPHAEDEYLWIGAAAQHSVLPCVRVAEARRCTSVLADTDIFVGSQHKAPLLDSNWFKDAFAQAVTCIGHTLLVLQPWDAPLPLTRSWCLWELLSTVDGGTQLDVVLSPAQNESFQRALVRAQRAAMRPSAAFRRADGCVPTATRR